MSSPRVSVVMAAYNRAHEIGEAIDSVLAQDFEDLELLVVDDGSKDRTEEIVTAYDDPRIRYIKKVNGGVGSARNAGIAAAKGEYLAYCDADDVQFPFRIGMQVQVLDAHPEVGLVYTDFKEWIDGKVANESILHTRWLGPSERNYRDDCEAHFSASTTCAALGLTVPSEYAGRKVYTGRVDEMIAKIHAAWGCVLMLRTEVARSVGGHWEEIRAFEDWVISSEVSKQHDLAYVDVPTCLYRVHPEQLTGRARLNAECYRDSINYVWRSDPIFYGKHKAIIDLDLATAHAILGEVEASEGNWREAEENFKHAIMNDPRVGKRPYVNLVLSALKRRVPATRSGWLGRMIPSVLGQSANTAKKMAEDDWTSG